MAEVIIMFREMIQRNTKEIALCCFVTLVLLLVVVGITTRTPFSDMFWIVIWGEDTKYSSSYDEAKFKEIRVGMSKLEVEQLLGKLLKISERHNGKLIKHIEFDNNSPHITYPDLPEDTSVEPTSITYFYSRQKTSTSNWFVKAVTFSKELVVTRITSDFYVD